MPQADIRHCERCRDALPPISGPGRPAKLCVRCRTPGFDGKGRMKPLPPDRTRLLALADPEPTRQVDDFVVLVANPHGLDAAGLALMAEYKDQPLSALHRRLLIEACRLADRAEKLHRILRGDATAWATMRIDEALREVAPDVPEIHVKITVTSMVQEARNTASALKAIILEISRALRQAQPEQEEGDPLAGIQDEIAAKREQHAS